VIESAPTLPPTERLILELLAESGPAFGLRLVELSNGRLKRGTVYVTLGRMEAKGFLSSQQEELPRGAIGLPRRQYQPTPLGLRALRAWGRYLEDLQLEVQP
jgi:DNA-binding PadR family transcriptional regulator